MKSKLIFSLILIAGTLLMLRTAEALSHGDDSAHTHASDNSAHYGGNDDPEGNGQGSGISAAVAESNSGAVSNSSSDSSSSVDFSGTQSQRVGQSTSLYQGIDTSDSLALDFTVEAEKPSADSAATVIAALCQSGMSAQTRAGGFSVSDYGQLCAYWRAAAIHYEAYLREKDRKECRIIECHVQQTDEGFVMGEIKACRTNPQALQYLRDYQWNLQAAQDLLVYTEHTAIADRAAGQLLKPLGLVALLLFAL